MEGIKKLTLVNPDDTKMIKNDKPRMDWLDALRALAMLFVIYGHTYKQSEFFLFTSPVKVPMFFAITGYLLYGKTEDIKTFLNRILHKIVIPWLILSLGFGLRFILTQGFAYYANLAVETLIGKQSWFMVCLIIAQTLFYFLQKIFGSGWKLGIAVLLITAGGLTLSAFGVGDLFQFRTALICQFYLLIGYWLKKYESKLQGLKVWMCLGWLGVYLALVIASVFLFPKRTLDIHMDEYYNIPYCFLLITVGCSALFVCAQRIKKFPRWLCAIGRNTLVYYEHDIFWRGMAGRVFSLLAISIPATWYGGLIWLIISCVGCGFEAYILNRFFPEANGKKRKKKVVQTGA
ncbi:MAG: acyltransferase [Oscillospiraceae bacterium]|nr:acyltransferase [Oscillospiraceae bacterium]